MYYMIIMQDTEAVPTPVFSAGHKKMKIFIPYKNNTNTL